MNKLTTETTPTPATPLVAEQGRPYTPGQGEAMRTPATMETAALAGSRREPRERADRILTTVLGALLGSVILGFVAIGSQLMSMHEAIGELRTEIGGLRTEMHVEISGLRNEMHEEISGLRNEMHEEIGGLRNEISELRDEMRTEMGKLSDRMTRIETSLQIRPGPLPGP